MADRKIRGGKKQDWLNASHFAKCSSGHHITRKWTDRLRKRTERHQWSIVCREGAPYDSCGSQYIKDTKIYCTICSGGFYKYKLSHFEIFGLIKALSTSMNYVYAWQCNTHTHTGLESIKTLFAATFQCKENCITSVPWNEHRYSYKAKNVSYLVCCTVYILQSGSAQLCLSDYERY